MSEVTRHCASESLQTRDLNPDDVVNGHACCHYISLERLGEKDSNPHRRGPKPRVLPLDHPQMSLQGRTRTSIPGSRTQCSAIELPANSAGSRSRTHTNRLKRPLLTTEPYQLEVPPEGFEPSISSLEHCCHSNLASVACGQPILRLTVVGAEGIEPPTPGL